MVVAVVVGVGLMAPNIGQQGYLVKKLNQNKINPGGMVLQNVETGPLTIPVRAEEPPEEEEVVYDEPFLGECMDTGTDRVLAFDSKDRQGGYLTHEYFYSALRQEVEHHNGERASCPYIVELFATQEEAEPDVIALCWAMENEGNYVRCSSMNDNLNIKFYSGDISAEVRYFVNGNANNTNEGWARLSRNFDYAKVFRVAEDYDYSTRWDYYFRN